MAGPHFFLLSWPPLQSKYAFLLNEICVVVVTAATMHIDQNQNRFSKIEDFKQKSYDIKNEL